MNTKDKNSSLSRVFFVGAGFSAGMQYPVGSKLMSRLVDFLQLREAKELRDMGFVNVLGRKPEYTERANQMVKVIEQVLRKYFDTDNPEKVDVAEFFTIAHTLAQAPLLLTTGSRRNTGNRSSEAPSEASLFEDLAAATRTYFTAIGEWDHHCKDIKSILKRLEPSQDVVVSFNWDEEVDIALDSRLDVAYTFGDWKASQKFLILKPHGSTGWYDVKQGIGNGDAYFIAGDDVRIRRSERRIMSYYDIALPKDIDKRRHPPLSCPPVITPPTFAKRFDYVEQHFIWQDVLNACSRAQDFVFLGYCLPKDDYLTRAAIRSALHSNPDRRRGSLRCLVVDMSFDEIKRANFESVFHGISRAKHFLKWNFGCGDPRLADKLEKKLKTAYLPR